MHTSAIEPTIRLNAMVAAADAYLTFAFLSEDAAIAKAGDRYTECTDDALAHEMWLHLADRGFVSCSIATGLRGWEGEIVLTNAGAERIAMVRQTLVPSTAAA